MEYEELTLANDFIFAKVMQNKELCKKLLEIILKIKIRDILYHEEQKVLEDSPDGKAVRLDVYVEDDENSVFDLEMQTTDTKELARRSRYYQGRIDVSILNKGTDVTYRDLKKSYVIFICMEDVLKAGRHIYTFENICCEDNFIRLDDGAVKVFLNVNSDMDDIDEKLENFLNYLKTGIPEDSFTKELDESVEFARTSKEWKEEYRMINMQKRIWRQDGMAEGKAEGIAEGKARGIRIAIEGMIKQNIPTDVIAKAIGVTPTEVETIKASMSVSA